MLQLRCKLPSLAEGQRTKTFKRILLRNCWRGRPGTQFACFTSTTVQILTPAELQTSLVCAPFNTPTLPHAVLDLPPPLSLGTERPPERETRLETIPGSPAHFDAHPQQHTQQQQQQVDLQIQQDSEPNSPSTRDLERPIAVPLHYAQQVFFFVLALLAQIYLLYCTQCLSQCLHTTRSLRPHTRVATGLIHQ